MTAYEDELKAIKLLKDNNAQINQSHNAISSDIEKMKYELAALVEGKISEQDITKEKKLQLDKMNSCSPVENIALRNIYAEARTKYDTVGLQDVLSIDDFVKAQCRYDGYVSEFNKRYELDQWDYAISAGCAVFAGLLDCLWVKAPLKPTVQYSQQVDGLFNQEVQKAFNKVISPELGKKFSKIFPVYSADTSVVSKLLGVEDGDKILNPFNHRLRALSHDPLLGLFFGAYDMLNNTCTVVKDGHISSFASSVTYGVNDNIENFSISQLIGRMLGHFASDINAPSANGNRGMGLPAPFMGLLRMLKDVPVGNSTFDKQIEYMFVNGYDCRQFIATSIPMAIMEILMRVFYIAKQCKKYDAKFGETVVDTLPLTMNPKFRIMLAIAYGTTSAINAGKIYVTQNIMNANCASWMWLVWHGFHALKWSLYDKHLKLWDGIMGREIANIYEIIENIESLENRANKLPK